MGLNSPLGFLASVGAVAVEPTCLVVEVSECLCYAWAGVDGAAWAMALLPWG
jgi:hypothetical protein